MFPLDEASARDGLPTLTYTEFGLDHGPIKMTMPDGEIMTGEYQVTENAAIGMGFAGGHSATAVGYGSGRPVAVNAIGDRGTILNCDGTADIAGNGTLICQTSKGSHYRINVLSRLFDAPDLKNRPAEDSTPILGT